MYGIKRNIKINPQVVKPVGKNSMSNVNIVGKSPRKFKNSGYGKYKYPKNNEIPDGQYFSKVVRVRDTSTNSGKPAIEVFYDIRDAVVCYKIANGWIADNGMDGIYHIRQKYAEDSSYYEDFVDSMAKALNNYDYDFDYEDVVGVTEHITFNYYGNFGSYAARMPFKFSEYKDKRLEQNVDNDDEFDEELAKILDDENYDERYNDEDDYIADDIA